MNQEESRLQQACVKLARLHNNFICEGVPAQAQRTDSGRLRMSSEGYIKGSSDLKLYNKEKLVFVEFKTLKGVQSKEQKAFQKLVESFGFNYYLCRSIVEFSQILNSEFNCKIKI